MKICIACGKSFTSVDWDCPYCGKAPVLNGEFLSFISDEVKSSESYDSRYFSELYQLESGHFWFQYRNRRILWALKTFFPSTRDVLEIGCGTGFVINNIRHQYPNLTISGSDLYLEGLNFARERVPDADFYQMDARSLPFQKEFDLILALDILEHIEDDQKALAEMYRTLKEGGGIILTVPQHRWLWSMQDVKSFHKRRYSRQELEEKMTNCGISVVHQTSYISFLLPIMIISRLYAQLFLNDRREYDPMRELRIRPALNSILNIICMVEEKILKRGIRLGVGGSMLCVGKKV
jgi:trans-aconitate methyltransferase